MCSLVQQLLSLELSNNDALVIQTDNDNEMGVPQYNNAEAVICRIDTDSGESWCFHPLLCVDEKLMLMPGIHGTITDVTKAARYTFGGKLDRSELLSVSYHNADFPRHLFSHLS